MSKKRSLTMDDYEITRSGHVINKNTGRILKGVPNNKGYLRVCIVGKLRFIHRLVAEKYVPNPLNKSQVNHIDGNKLNNSASNLEWVTNLENREHAIKNNLHLCGERSYFSKLKNEDVIYILNNHELNNVELAKKFGVSRTTISSIRNGRTWKQLKSYAELT